MLPPRIVPAVLALALLLACCRARGAATGSAPWQAGVAKTVITPTEPIWMAGFGSRTQPSTGVRADIFVRAMALRDSAGALSVLVTLDLVAIDRAMADEIAHRCVTRFGLSRERLWLNVSHNHSGPVAGIELMPMYDLNAEQRAVVARYSTGLMASVVDTVGRAIADAAPARVEFAQGLAGIAVNRRRVRQRDLPGPVDHDVPVFAIRALDGRLRAVVVGYATHATALSDNLISADWPGFALEAIEQQHAGAVALFVQGCGADANPLPRGTEELARQHGRTLAAAVDEVLRTRMKEINGPLSAAFDTVDVAFDRLPTRAELQERTTDKNKYVRLQAQRLLEAWDRDGGLRATYPYPVQVWRFGGDLTLIALGGEVVVDYSLRLKRQYGFNTTWVAGYSNDIPAYIPSRRVLGEGGYEAGEAMIYFGRPGPFAPTIEDAIVGKVDELVRKVGGVPALAPK